MTTSPSIAIVGGGPCGLTLARLLECKNIDYVVFERDESASISNREGGSLDIHYETGQRALREAGLIAEFEKHARYEDERFQICGPDGKETIWIIGGDKTKPDLEKPKTHGRPEIDRSVLRQILLDSIPKEKIRWGHALKEVVLGGDGKPVLKFKNGQSATGFRLVAGSDGIWSHTRNFLSQILPVFSGRHYVETRIEKNNPVYDTVAKRVGFGTLSCMGSERTMLFMRQGDASYRIYMGLMAKEDAMPDLGDVEGTRAYMLSPEAFGSWAEEFKTCISHVTHFRNWPLYYLPEEALNWSGVLGVTLLGDAAHGALPNGEGVNLAMTDAMDLVDKIIHHGLDSDESLNKALREYEEIMIPRGKDSIRSGFQITGSMLQENNPEAFVQSMKGMMEAGQQ